MAQRESKLSRRIMEKLRMMGAFAFKVHGSEYMMAGLPDIVACVDGVFVGFETKVPGKRDNLSPHQAYTHDQIRRARGRVHVVCSVREVEIIVDALRSGSSVLETDDLLKRHAQSD